MSERRKQRVVLQAEKGKRGIGLGERKEPFEQEGWAIRSSVSVFDELDERSTSPKKYNRNRISEPRRSLYSSSACSILLFLLSPLIRAQQNASEHASISNSSSMRVRTAADVNGREGGRVELVGS